MRSAGLVAWVWLATLTWASWAQGQDLTSTSGYAVSFQNQRHVARAASGTIAMLYQKGGPAKSGGGLVLVTSRDDGRTWSDARTLVTISNVFADVAKGPGDDLYVVYTKNSDSLSASADVGFLKLAYDALSDTWGVERQAVVFDSVSTTAGYNGVVAWDGAGLWVAYRHRDGAGFRIVVKHSSDDGVTWRDAVDADAPGPDADETAAFVRIGDRLALVYYHQNVEFRWRWRVAGDPPDRWQPSETIFRLTQNLPSKSSYSVVGDGAGRIHLLFSSRGVQYLRYDGTAWAAAPVLLEVKGTSPTVGSDGSTLWAAWQLVVGTSQSHIVASRLDPAVGVWSPATPVTPSAQRQPDAAWCFAAAFGHLSDVTAAAGSLTSGDVKSAVTGFLLRDVGDAFYYGQDVPFDYVRVQLKIKGLGGAVAWEYWNGGAWTAITPVTGSYHFTTHASVWLWRGPSQVPADWQRLAVGDATPRYYVRARVTTAFGTAPTGTQITSIKPNETPTTMERDSAFRLVTWLERIMAPYAVPSAQPEP